MYWRIPSPFSTLICHSWSLAVGIISITVWLQIDYMIDASGSSNGCNLIGKQIQPMAPEIKGERVTAFNIRMKAQVRGNG